MIKVAVGITLGLIVGVIVAAVAAPFAGVDGFSGRTFATGLGYASSALVGALVGLGAQWPRELGKRGFVFAVIAVLATFVLRGLPMPWVNLVWLDGTAGPAGELPFVILPVLGMGIGALWGGKIRT